MNLPNDPRNKEIPDQAKDNPVYEQTRQDMPLFCCGRNCGRNSRIVVLVLAIIGISASVWACLSPNLFSFVAVRNDTFYDQDKAQPEPFEYATEADVGLFKYRILDVYEYPWPPNKNERKLFDQLLLDEIRRLQDATNGTEQNVTSDIDPEIVNATDISNTTLPAMDNVTEAPLDGNETAVPVVDSNATEVPVGNETEVPVIPPVGVGSNARSLAPTTTPTAAPTITNPNIAVEDTVDLNVVKNYEDGVNQFDSMFTNAQRGAIMAPIFAFIGTVFGLIELCCCTYKCSWLPTALFLYMAFMFQMFTLFLFLTEDFCKYAQDCAIGIAGIMSVLATICYMIAQSLVCCSPRPPPCFNCCKKPPVRRKKKKKKKKGEGDEDDDDEGSNLNRDYDDPDYDGQKDSFRDEPNGYVDPYDEGSEDDNDDYDYDEYGNDSYDGTDDSGMQTEENDVYTQGGSTYYDDGADTYGDGTYTDSGEGTGDGESSYYTEEGEESQYEGEESQYEGEESQYEGDSQYEADSQYEGDSQFESDRGWSTGEDNTNSNSQNTNSNSQSQHT